MSLVDTLNAIWTQILALTQVFVMPDWGKLVNLLPVFVLIGLIGPFVTFTMLGAMVYLIRRPRVHVTFVEGPREAEIGPGGEPVFPVGLPHCRRHALVFDTGTTRCSVDREALSVICPMCNLGRLAEVDTCSNCGLVLKVKPRAVAVRKQTGPKPGGAAVA